MLFFKSALNVSLLFLFSTMISFMVASNAQAARPFLTDDATIVDDCQVESWWQQNKPNKAHEFWVMPACQFLSVEWGLGFGKINPLGDKQVEFSAKGELQTLGEHQWGVTWQLGYEFNSKETSQGDSTLNFSFSKAFLDEKLLMHLNLGYQARYQDKNDWLSGLALQWNIKNEQWIFAEVFREEGGRPWLQVGYLNEVVPERLQLDFGIGQRSHGYEERSGVLGQTHYRTERFISAGFVYYFSLGV